MPHRIQFTIFFILSLALHALVLAALLLIPTASPESPHVTPVQIVNLPRKELQTLPPLRQPRTAEPPPPAPGNSAPAKRLPPEAVPSPKKFGTGEEFHLPKTMPRQGQPEGTKQGGEEVTGEARPRLIQPPGETGPLPFVSRKEIEELARKGMPEKRPGDDSVTLDTDEFKYISYNRWLKIKVESVLHYPELAAVSGYQGQLYIQFDILKDGSLGRVEVLKPSGYKILDDEAVRAIRSAAPFQPLPEEWRVDRYSIRAAVIFYLGGGYIR